MNMPSRRSVLAGGLAGLTAVAVTVVKADLSRPRDFVLVHGAWHGGWCWRYVRERLIAAGHRVFTPTLTGLGERSHLLTTEIGLQTHIEDVVQLIQCEELEQLVLCGHSYGGMVITGVADRLRERIAHVVYLDAAVPFDGQSMLTEGPQRDAAAQAAAEAQLASLLDENGYLPVFPPEGLGVLPSDPDNYAWLQRRLTPHPFKTWQDTIDLRNGGSEGLPRTYVLCTDPMLPSTSFAWHASRAQQLPDWRYTEIATGHDAMVTAPDETTAVLLSALL
jgi:pimeloyl-ACP methyl ester carboxylesterase